MTARSRWVAILAGLAWGGGRDATVGAQAVGPEFQVSEGLTYGGMHPSVAAAADGRFVVAFVSVDESAPPPPPVPRSWGVFGRTYDSDGEPLSAPFLVNSYTPFNQNLPSVAVVPDGSSFVVTWQSRDQDGSGYGVFGRRYGAVAGPEFRVNSYTTGYQMLPIVAGAADGSFIVAWRTGAGPGPDADGFMARLHDTSGQAIGTEFLVAVSNKRPALSAAADGRFVVAWWNADGSGYGVFARRYDSNGLASGPEFRVNSYTTGDQLAPSVTVAPDGRFVVTWSSRDQDGSGVGVFGQRYDSNGLAMGAEFQVNSFTTGNQQDPSLATAADGRFVVTWNSYLQDGSGFGVFGQMYAATGLPSGPEFRIHSSTSGVQCCPSVAAAADGRFIVTWEEPPHIWGRRFHMDVIFADSFGG
jgi:hypothetical protein